MKVLDDIWTSIKGNAITRIKDPIIGAFIVSWCLCNWDRLTILFLGSDKLEKRINHISQEMAFFDSPSLVWTNLDLLVLPLVLTIFYIFILPVLAHFVDELLSSINSKRHVYAIDTDISKALKQKDLNKAKLRANPENEFLAQEVKIDIEREKSEAEIIKADAETAKNKQIESKAKATSAQVDLEKKELKAESEQRALTISAAKQKAELASHRFPSAYMFIEALAESAEEDGVKLPLNVLSSSVATIFGYKDFSELLSDKEFTNNNIGKLKYVIIEPDSLTIAFSELLEDEVDDEFDSEWLVGHFEMIFERLPYELIHIDTLAEKIREEIEIESYDLLQEEGVISGMAETDTIFDEVDEIILDKYQYDNNHKTLCIELSGSASGSHRKESGVPGQSIDIKVEATCNAVIGRYGLGEYHISATSSPTFYD